MPTYPKLKLTYFDLAGRAEGTRLALFLGGIPFEDNRISLDDMVRRKHEFPYGVLPVLQVDDQVLAESSAIARFVGRLAGLYPTNNPVGALLVDEIMLAVDAFSEAFRPWCSAADAAVKQAEEKKLMAETVPTYFAQIEAQLAKLQAFVSFQDETRLWIHELWIYQHIKTVLLAGWLPFLPPDVHHAHKHWVEVEAKVENHTRVREYTALQRMRPKQLKLASHDNGDRTAEPIRLAFHLGGVAFEDARGPHGAAAVDRRAPSLPTGRVPVLEIDGGTVIAAHSYAILRYAGTLAGLYPSDGDLVAALRIDEILAVLDQMHNVWSPAFAETDPEKKRAMMDVVVKTTIPHYLGGLDKRIAAGAAPFATGTKLTIADLAVFGVVDFLKSGVVVEIPTIVADEFHALTKIHALVRGHESLQAYYARCEQP